MNKFLAYIGRFVKTDIGYLTRGGFWLSAKEAVISLIGLGLAVGFANLLPKEIYGNYRYILSLSGILGVLALSGMGTAVMQSVARGFDGTVREAFKIKLIFGILILLVSLGGSIYYWFNNNLTLAISLIFVGIFLPFIESGNIYAHLLIGKRFFKDAAIYGVAYRLITAIVLLAVIFLTDNVIMVVAAYFISCALLSSLFFYGTTKKYIVTNQVDWEALKFGKQLSAVNIISNIAVYIDQIIIFHFLGAAQLAVYSFALVAPQKIRGLIRPVSQLALPKFAERDFPEIKKTLPRKLFFMLVAVLALTGVYAAAAPWLFSIFFSDYVDSVFLSQIASLVIIGELAPVINSALQAHKKIIPIAFLSTALPILKIGLIVVFGYLLGLLGIVIAQVVYRWLELVMYGAVLQFS